MLNPLITQKLSEVRDLNGAAAIWIEHPDDLKEHVFIISSPGPLGMHWPARIDMERGGFLRSIFAHDQIHFASHSVLSSMVNEGETQIPIDYSIGFDINVAQYLRRLVDDRSSDTILRFKRCLQGLARRQFNWEVFPFLEERSEDIIEGRDLEDIWKVVYASEYFAHSDLKYFSETGELHCQVSENILTQKSRELLSGWHTLLIDGELDRIRQARCMLQVLLLKVGLIHLNRPSPRDAGRNLAEFLGFMCGENGINLPWMMWAAANFFEMGGRFEPLRKLTAPASSLSANSRNVAWDFMHFYYRKGKARFIGQEDAFLVPYTLTFDRGLASIFSGFGQRSCLFHKDDSMGQFFAEYDPQSEVIERYSNCSALMAIIDRHLSMKAHLTRKMRIQRDGPLNRQPLLDELLRECESLS